MYFAHFSALQRMEIEIQPDEMPKEETSQKEQEPTPEISVPEEPAKEVPQQQETTGPEPGVQGEAPDFTVLLQSMTVKDTERVIFKVREIFIITECKGILYKFSTSV